MQSSQSISYCSRLFIPCEVGYAPTEKEHFSIIRATEKFHQYIYGNDVLLECDHKALLPIFVKKDLSSITRDKYALGLKSVHLVYFFWNT